MKNNLRGVYVNVPSIDKSERYAISIEFNEEQKPIIIKNIVAYIDGLGECFFPIEERSDTELEQLYDTLKQQKKEKEHDEHEEHDECGIH